MTAALDLRAVELFKKRVLNDTGILCRELFGYNYDEEGGVHVNIGKGGIVAHGKTQEIVEILDGPTQFKYVKAPRGARKSTLAQGFCGRHILKNPNVRICYIGRTDDIVNPKSLALRNLLEREEITELFGKQRGDGKWEETEFTVAGRTSHGLQSATFTAMSMDSLRTGGRYDIIVFDDFIDHTNVTNQEQNKKAKEKWALVQPMLAPGGIILVFCTTWADDDLNAELESSPMFQPPNGVQLICGAGAELYKTPDGRDDVRELPGGLLFPHLTIQHLREKLHGMALQGKTGHFCRQYFNIATSQFSSNFHRSYFHALPWNEDMRGFSGFLLTDTATSEEEESCFSVVAYALLDAFDNVYLVDLRIGHWKPSEFKDHFFAILEDWQYRVNHIGECWEEIALVTSYISAIEEDSRARKTKLRPITMPRTAKNKKADRIKRLEPAMRHGKFFVVSTMPRTYVDVDGERELWCPDGMTDPLLKRRVATGELVDEFVKGSAKRDIPDAIAMLLEYEQTRPGIYKRMCQYKPYVPKARPGQGKPLTREPYQDYARAEDPLQDGTSSDWWDRKLGELGF